MRLLLDTCALLWFLRGDQELSRRAAAAIEESANEAVVSVASIWEIAIKTSLGKLQKPDGFETDLESDLVEAGFVILPVSYSHAARVASLPYGHRDPFDRLLICQCIVENLAAVTDDLDWSRPEYGLSVIW